MQNVNAREQGPRPFADRYELNEQLGRGGMACVYRAIDLSSGRAIALKQLIRPEHDGQRAHLEQLFEHEFHTLAQLSHPRVIAAYDFGITADGVHYYTMELLDGGDLRERAPVPWREACRLVFDVCSSLALLHSRRLLHRDISPRNIRCTRDGTAKLIDFGAMAPMSGGGSSLVGTPAFTAPETVHRSALDARTDLYSLGASLYYALTGQLPYPARTFAELFTLWNERPAPPSTRVADIPIALDVLVLSLLSLEPSLRPPSAFAVMQQLAAIADLESDESADVSKAYLVTPALAGRETLLRTLRDKLVVGLSVGGKAVMLRGATGLGRSRMLDACALEAKTLGARVLRAAANGQAESFDVALALTRHLIEALPSEALAEQVPQLFQPLAAAEQTSTNEGPVDAPARSRLVLRDPAALRADPEQLQQSIPRLIRAASKIQSLVLAVDDVHRIDEPSAAVLAALIDKSRHGRMVVALTAESGAADTSPSLDVLSRRCDEWTLEPLTHDQTQTLFDSMFGDVPNLQQLVEEIYRIARGNPQQSIDLAQHLIDRGVITYAAGTWTLPRGLSDVDLPKSAEDAIRKRINSLEPLARRLAETHALAFREQLTHEDYLALASDMDARAVDAAINQLISQQAIVGDSQQYVIANRVWRAALDAELTPETRKEWNRALSELYRTRGDVAWIHHAFAAGAEREEQALDALLERQVHYAAEDDPRHTIEEEVSKLIGSYPRAFEVAERLKRPVRQTQELRRWLIAISVAHTDASYYWLAAPTWLAQLTHDSGLDEWRKDAANTDAGARLTQALTRAFERQQAIPEAERVYRVDEAIPLLAEYVVCSIAIGVRTMDYALIQTLPGLLEPFAPLSPLLEALWQNARNCNDCYEFCHYERARERWIEVHAKLQHVTGVEVRHVTAIRNAIAYAVGMLEAAFGLASAANWADQLDDDPYQRVNALYLRKIVRLQQGDWTAADKLQRQAEVLALRARVPQMFSSTLTVEIAAHALSRDLAGVKHVIDRERVEAARYPGWLPYVTDAEARFELIRGDLVAAKAGFERAIELSAVDAEGKSRCMPVWVAAQGGLCEALLELERAAEARECALAALAVCEKNQIGQYSNDLVRLLALAEAKLGDFAPAIARLDRLIETQTRLGVTGLRIGLSYEARAQIAIWCGDAAAFAEYARRTAYEYRYGARCPLSARYERLTHDARRRGFQPGAALGDFETTTFADSSVSGGSEIQSVVELAFAGAHEISELYARALRLVCRSRGARGGHLYVPANDGSALVASCDMAMPGDHLAEHVSELLEQNEDRMDTLTIAIDRNAGEDVAMTEVPTAQVDGVDYELVLLSCVQNQNSKIAGVIAIVAGPQSQPNPRQTQLLSTIAARLVQRA
jgi:hypothetical protein